MTEIREDAHRILIVDDDKGIHEDLETILLNHSQIHESVCDFEKEVVGVVEVRERMEFAVDFEVDHAYQGKEALELVDKAHADGNPFSLIFMDILLPPGEDGISTVSAIWKKHSDIEVVLCTAYPEFKLADIISKLGMTDQLLFMRKPFDTASIIQMALALTRKCALHRKSKTYIEDLRRTNAELAREKETSEIASNAKSDFLDNMSHELRTPLHAVLSFSKFGMRKVLKVDTDKLLHYFFQINVAGNRLLALLNDLLDLSRLESGRMVYKIESYDIRYILNSSLEELRSALDDKRISFRINDSQLNMVVDCDKNKVGQVIRNLLSNAIKYTPEGESFEVSFEHAGFVDASGKMREGLTILVKDEGIGLPEDELTSVFDKFIQSSKTKTGAGGTGLGLAISHEIVKAHGGRIWAENNQDKGATFAFTLPYYR
jgi:two-component system, sensor histidine kinase